MKNSKTSLCSTKEWFGKQGTTGKYSIPAYSIIIHLFDILTWWRRHSFCKKIYPTYKLYPGSQVSSFISPRENRKMVGLFIRYKSISFWFICNILLTAKYIVEAPWWSNLDRCCINIKFLLLNFNVPQLQCCSTSIWQINALTFHTQPVQDLPQESHRGSVIFRWISILSNSIWKTHTLCRALAGILKLPVIFQRIPVQNGLKWSKMGQNCIKWYFFAWQKQKLAVTHKNEGHDRS